MNYNRKLMEIYKDGEVHTTQEIYQKLGCVDDLKMQHSCRGAQQNLKKQGLIENVKLGFWQIK